MGVSTNPKPTKNEIRNPKNQAFSWKFIGVIGKWKWTQREKDGKITSHRDSQ